MPKNTSNKNNKSVARDNGLMFLDTVALVIRLPCHMESTRYPFKRLSNSDPLVWFYERKSWGQQYIFTRKKSFLLGDSEYKPALKYRVRHIGYGGKVHELVVEFSIPKLLLGNNFMDTSKSELDVVHSRILSSITGTYHFEDVTLEMIENATLKRMDCGSQVIFPDIESYNLAQERIGSARLSLRLDIERPQFSERSTGLSISCSSYQFVVYNKTEELRRYAKSPKKAKFEADDEWMVEDEDFFRVITDTKKTCMRFELRFNTKAKIDNALKHIGEPARALTLQTALERNIPQRLLQWLLEQIVKGLPRADLVLASSEDVLNHVSKVEDKPDNIAKLYGYAMMERLPDQRKLREIITNGKKRSAWTSYLKKLDNLPELSGQKEPIQPILDKVFGVLPSNTNTSSDVNDSVANVISVESVDTVIVRLTISITIKYCTKNRYFFRTTWLLCRANTRAPPSWLAVRRGIGGSSVGATMCSFKT